jgi:hypothetical protein
MKKLLILAVAAFCSLCQAQSGPDLQVENRLIGSGEQAVTNAKRFTNAKLVGDYGVYHVPQFLPYYPTAATIWPRVIEVKCKGAQCDGYDWTPDMGRGEYVYFRAVQVAVAPAPVVLAAPPPAPMPVKKINQ